MYLTTVYLTTVYLTTVSASPGRCLRGLPCTFPVPSLYLPCTFPVPSLQEGVYFSEEEDFPLITAFSQVLALVCDPRKNVAWKVQRYGVVRPRPVHW